MEVSGLVAMDKEDLNPLANDNNPHAPVVALGSSAGGLEALTQFFQHVPTDSGIAFIVITHQLPDRVSLLPEIVAKQTQLTVVEAKDGDRLKANHVFVAPPGAQLAVFHNTLQLFDTASGSSPQLPIDSCFRSLAQDLRDRAIGIILSGTGTDGTLGIRAIKGESGMVMVQNPITAKYDGMPQSAISTRQADYVLDVADMPSKLMAYISGNWPSDAVMDELSQALPKIFNQIRARTGNDFSSYKLNTVRRRVQRRMNMQQIYSPLAYIGFLQENPHEIDQLFNELLITVTSFFRDPEAFDELTTIVRKGLEASTESEPYRVWVSGCATGEEAYSIAILIDECLSDLRKQITVQVFATDLDNDAIETARIGRYPEGIAGDIDAQRLERYFTKEDNNYRITKYIREMVVFAQQNMIKDPPFTRLNLLTCRNALIYLNRDLQSSLLPVFHYSLVPDGLLLLGTSETVGTSLDLFAVESKKWKIYRRIESETTAPPELPIAFNKHEIIGSAAFVKPARLTLRPVTELLNEHLVATFVPPTVIVDRQGDIIHVHGKTGRYLELPPGQPSNNLIQMARDGLQLDLAAALRHASASDEPMVHNHIMVKSNSDVTEVDISVRRITEPEAIRGLILVTFLPAFPKEENHSSNGSDIQHQQSRFEKLELELQFMKGTLQNAIQQSDITNEELKSTNEELQSTNEELQSANEELETSKEEMQSLNEELQTVNTELSTKLEELSHSHDDMQNLLNSTEIATLFLDNDTKIKRYAKSATKVFKVRDVDVGRPLSEIVHNLDYNDLADDAKRVLDTLVFVEKEILTRDGKHSYRVRILPYRTFENMIDGVVITLVDIKEIQEARDYAESIIATISEPFLVLNDELRIVSSNSAFYHYFQLAPEAIKDKLIGEIGTRQWDNNKLRRLLNSIVHENSSFNDFEITSAFQQNGHSKIYLSGHLLMQRLDQPRLVLLTFSEQPLQSDQTAVPIEG